MTVVKKKPMLMGWRKTVVSRVDVRRSELLPERFAVTNPVTNIPGKFTHLKIKKSKQ